MSMSPPSLYSSPSHLVALRYAQYGGIPLWLRENKTTIYRTNDTQWESATPPAHPPISEIRWAFLTSALLLFVVGMR